jgi:nucleoside-diphosphate-sugar epimerase
VLVTGGSGFVGSAVLANLLARGRHVVATATTTAGRVLPSHPELEWTAWDALAGGLPTVAWSEIDAVLHLAVSRTPFRFPVEAESHYELSVGATFRLLEAARAQGVRRFLLASTGDVLGGDAVLVNESDISYRPSSFYGSTKACAELMVRGYSGDLSTAILRIFHPYGPEGDRFLVNRLFERVRSGQEVRIQGSDGILLNPVWIDDLASGIANAVESGAGGIFHFAGPDMVSLREMLTNIGSIVEVEPKVISEPGTPPGGHAGTFERSTRELGYAPGVRLIDGLKRLLEVQTSPV